jgi:hypothetical protein
MTGELGRALLASPGSARIREGATQLADACAVRMLRRGAQLRHGVRTHPYLPRCAVAAGGWLARISLPGSKTAPLRD